MVVLITYLHGKELSEHIHTQCTYVPMNRVPGAIKKIIFKTQSISVVLPIHFKVCVCVGGGGGGGGGGHVINHDL